MRDPAKESMKENELEGREEGQVEGGGRGREEVGRLRERGKAVLKQ